MATPPERNWFTINPTLGDQQPLFIRFCKRIEQEAISNGETVASGAFRHLRGEVALGKYRPHSIEEIRLRLVNNVVLDLVAQGWQLKVEGNHVQIRNPLQHSDSPASEKERVRRGHLLERDAQLGKRSVADFVRSMERRRLTKRGWHSIFSVMRDGRELSEKLKRAASVADET
jgi:hypothetical protein